MTLMMDPVTDCASGRPAWHNFLTVKPRAQLGAALPWGCLSRSLSRLPEAEGLIVEGLYIVSKSKV